MKRITIASILVASLSGAAAAADVGISINFSQPGVFGRIDIGQYPQPQVIAPQPVLVMPPPEAVPLPQPVYLWVPPGHREHWERYCGEYNACGHPVYFVDHDWYERNVMERHRREHDESEDGRGRGHGHGRGHDREGDRGDD